MEESEKKPETPEGIKTTPNLIDAARVEREAYAAETTRRELVVAREEVLAAERMLGGRAEAGETAEKPKEDTPEDYAKKALSGEMD